MKLAVHLGRIGKKGKRSGSVRKGDMGKVNRSQNSRVRIQNLIFLILDSVFWILSRFLIISLSPFLHF